MIRELGRGGQATVHLAEDTRLRREVALKVLDAGAGTNRFAIDRFRREAEIASKLDHPAICPVYEIGEDRGALYIAMRYVDGEPLSTRIASRRSGGHSEMWFSLGIGSGTEGPRATGGSAEAPQDPTGDLPLSRAEIDATTDVIEQVARALHTAHERGVVHRDIKPGNIMLGRTGTPVILDFGLARHAEAADAALTATGDTLGTPAYMSPEQLTANRIRPDHRTDIYSLGVTLFEALTLRRPFEAPTREALYKQILGSDPADPRVLNPAITRDLRVVIETAIEKDRDRRYQTALDFAEDLRRVRTREPILAKPIGPLARLSRWAQRNPAIAASVSGSFIVLAAGLVVSLTLLGQRNQALADKSEALVAYDRLGDLPRVQALVASVGSLWPATEATVPAMERWLAQAREVRSRLPVHEAELVGLRHEALPYSDEDRAADALLRAEAERRLETARAERERSVIETAAPVESHDLDARIVRLAAAVPERSTWRLASAADQFRHDAAARLVAALTEFVRSGAIESVEARLALARSVAAETTGRFRGRWEAAIASIGDAGSSPAYRGLRIAPQPGLVPIGKNPVSGLWEFVHVATCGAWAPGGDPTPARFDDGCLLVTDATGLVFVLLPGGAFRMGAIVAGGNDAANTPNADPDADLHERPLSDIGLDPFFFSKFEITQRQWERVTGGNPSTYRPGLVLGGRMIAGCNPVEGVTWDDASLWLGRLGLLLPTEAQWEYGARAGTSTPRWTGLDAAGLDGAARFGDPGGGHVRVGTLAPNPYGLHDILGNVMEWCRDGLGPYELAPAPGDGFRDRPAAQARVCRGGGFGDESKILRSAYREGVRSGVARPDLGLRPVRRIDP